MLMKVTIQSFVSPSRYKRQVICLLIVVCILLSFSLTQINKNEGLSKLLISPSTTLPVDFKNVNDLENLWRPTVDVDVRRHVHDDRILSQYQWIERMTNSKLFDTLKPKKILVLDGFNAYAIPSGQLNCPTAKFESKCQLIEDKLWFYRNPEEFDGIMGVRNWDFKIFEAKISPHVRQILFTMESPFVTLFADFSVNNAVLASYYRGSDIVTPYRKWVPHSTILNSTNRNYAQDKKKLAAIVVSDCRPDNRRLDYVKELQNYVKVDIYGRCGTLKCGDNCFNDLKKDYKFYLAFENANCVDYITEKFFNNALEHDMIPIVLGARREDYAVAAPQNSYIHVEDFETPWDLAKYMIKLDEDDDAFNSYFKWKGSGELINPWNDLFCRACALLHYEDFVKAPVWSKGATWRHVNKCLARGKWYWDRDG